MGDALSIGRPVTRRNHAFAAIAAGSGAPVPMSAIVAHVYGDTPPRAAAESLRSIIKRLRQEVREAGGDIELVPGSGYLYRAGPTEPAIGGEPTADVPAWVPDARSLAGRGIPLASIARALGVDRDTVRRHCPRPSDPDAVARAELAKWRRPRRVA